MDLKALLSCEERERREVAGSWLCTARPGREPGVPSGGQAAAVLSTNFSFYSVSLQSLPLTLTLSLSVSLPVCLLRDRQVMEKQLKGKIQGKCK